MGLQLPLPLKTALNLLCDVLAKHTMLPTLHTVLYFKIIVFFKKTKENISWNLSKEFIICQDPGGKLVVLEINHPFNKRIENSTDQQLTKITSQLVFSKVLHLDLSPLPVIGVSQK
jgi:hypothetical protein